MGSASQSLFMMVLFPVIMTRTIFQSSALHVSIPDTYMYATTGQTKSIECNVLGLSVSFVTWSHEDTFLTVGTKFFWTYNPSSGRADLIVYSVTEADSGKYTCLAENTAGVREQASLVLTVEDTLSVTTSTVANDGIVGLDITIPCTITGRPITTVEWSFNNEKLSKSSQYSWNTGSRADLHISTLTVDSSGTYACIASNEVSEQQGSVYLTVKSQPIVTIQSNKPDFGTVGHAKTLSCYVMWTSVSIITWYCNGIPINISSKYTWTQSLISGHADLTMSALSKSDSGIYTCHARSDAGTFIDSVNLTAEDMLDVTVPYTTAIGIVGDAMTLQCSITGTPISYVSWSFNGYTLINDNEKHYWSTSSTPYLHFESLTIADEGTYKCSASNDVGTNSASITLTIIAKPVVTIGNSEDLHANEGESVIIPCVVTKTTSVVSLQWYYQNKFLCHSDPRLSWTSASAVSFPFDCSLKIYKVMPQDTGTYRCQATNNAGVGEDSINLLVPDHNSHPGAGSEISHEKDHNSPGCDGSETWDELYYKIAALTLAVVLGIILLLFCCWRLYKCVSRY